MTEQPPRPPDPPEPRDAAKVWDELSRLPSLDEAPIDEEWYRAPVEPREEAPAEEQPMEETVATAPTGAEPTHYHVPAPDAVPDRQPPSTPAPADRPPAPRRRRRWPWWTALTVLLVLVAVAAGAAIYSWVLWNRIDRIELEGVLTGGSSAGTNYLIVGTDSREGLADDVDNANVIFGDVSGQRTDTVLLLRTSDAGAEMMALPRDLWVEIAGTGSEDRINTAIQGGPERLVRTVQESLGIPIDHYLEVDFAGFIGLVDAVGGVTIEFEHPAYDTASGLNIVTAGAVELDSGQALAYVRSRNYTEVIDGVDVTDPTADLGRVERQQEFMRAVFGKVGATRNPWSLLQATKAMSDTIRIDDGWGYWDAVGFALDMGGLDPTTVVLPTFPFTTPGGAAVLGLADGAEAVLDGFR